MRKAAFLYTPWYAPAFTHWLILLIMPLPLNARQTWLDERLFGWSRSARRGTSAWAGTRSHEISRAATPDASDEEDAPDYDDLLAVPGGLDGAHSLAARPRSQRSSYADLQRLRRSSSAAAPANGNGLLQPLSPTSTSASSSTALASPSDGKDKDKDRDADGEGLHFRGQTRPRKPSLSDNVPVEVIGQVDPTEPFGEATSDLNEEMEKRREGSDASH